MKKFSEVFKLKRNYDIEALARSYGFTPRLMEKVCRLSDVLEDLSAIRFLKNRLSLYGGTALVFIYYDEILRLSIDIDFNYRHLGERDWGDVRDEIDQRIKELLYHQGYASEDVAIDPHYPLNRFNVAYRNMHDLRDSFKIEIGYMHRYPILRADTLAEFRHLGTQEPFLIKSPQKEELFANKWCTLLYRRTPRDLFDVHQILSIPMNLEIFRKCAVVESFMQRQGPPRLHKLDIAQVIPPIQLDSAVQNLLLQERTFDFSEMKAEVMRFSISVLESLTKNEIRAIDQFFEGKQFAPELIDDAGLFHEALPDHPSIQWAIQQMR